jgi:hypothetical protein
MLWNQVVKTANCQEDALSAPLLFTEYLLTLRPAGGEPMQSGGKSVLLKDEQLTAPGLPVKVSGVDALHTVVSSAAYRKSGSPRNNPYRCRKNSELGLSVSWLRRHGTRSSVQSRTGPLRRDGPGIGIVTANVPRFSGRVQRCSGFFCTLGLRHTYEGYQGRGLLPPSRNFCPVDRQTMRKVWDTARDISLCDQSLSPVV